MNPNKDENNPAKKSTDDLSPEALDKVVGGAGTPSTTPPPSSLRRRGKGDNDDNSIISDQILFNQKPSQNP